jgi:hypothetical protein
MRARKGKGWIGYRDRTHVSLRSPAEWIAMAGSAGFRLRKIFSDGFWDPPYIRGLPVRLQRLLFGLPGGVQAMLAMPFLPVRWGESVILIVQKEPRGAVARTSS